MKFLFLSLGLGFSMLGFSQTQKTLESYGPVYEVEDPDFKIDLNQEFKAVFDVSDMSEFKDKPNSKFVTLARYLRLHQSPEHEKNAVKAALVIHGSAIFDLLTDEEYAKYHQEKNLKNPNLELLSVLTENNVDIILCGQTSKHRGIDKAMIHPKVQIALSAMTALIEFQKINYSLINF